MTEPKPIPQSGQLWWLGWSPQLAHSPTVLTFNLDDGVRWLTIRVLELDGELRKTLWLDGRVIGAKFELAPATWESCSALAKRLPPDARLRVYLRNPTEIALAALKQEFERGN